MQFITLLVFIGLYIISPIALVRNDPGEEGRPNIIFLLADDLRWDYLGYSGMQPIRTPAIDQLANQGVVFRNAYVTTSICSVSRASILSGQYGRRHGKWGFGPGFAADEWMDTYPGILKNAGYKTGFIGKYGVGNIDYASQQFDYWKGFPGQGSFNAQDDQGNPIHLTRLIGQQAAEFIEGSVQDTPFVLSISFKAPHVENASDKWRLYDPAYAEEFENAEFIQPLSAEVDHFMHFNESFLNGNEARVRYTTRFGNPAVGQESLEGYSRLIYGIDRALDQILQTLVETGMQDNTIIIFTSDNGMYLGEYGFSGKWYGSDPSIRVPLFIFDPRMSGSVVRDEIVLNIDIAPTLLEYAGVEVEGTMQGNSLVPLAAGDVVNDWRTDFLYEHLWPTGNNIFIPSAEGVVNDSSMYMRYFIGFDPEPVIQEEYYNTVADPFQIKNEVDNPEFAQKRDGLITRLNALIESFE